MRLALIASLALILNASLAGCTGDPDFGATLNVDGVEADSDVDYCGDEEGWHCDTLSATVDVHGGSDFSLNMFYFDAVISNGSIISTPWVNGPDSCAAGYTCSFTLDFDVPDGEQIVELRWDNMFDETSCIVEGVY